MVLTFVSTHDPFLITVVSLQEGRAIVGNTSSDLITKYPAVRATKTDACGSAIFVSWRNNVSSSARTSPV